MNSHAEKKRKTQSHSIAARTSERHAGSGSAFELVDNRSKSIAQRKLHEMSITDPRQAGLEEEELLQGKLAPVQRQEPANGEVLQGRMSNRGTSTQRQDADEPGENRTGMPNQLKTGLERLSGLDLSGLRVHYDSAKPAELNALAYTQGQDLHVAPGQEKHLPNEGWHVARQMQGRVQPTMQAKGVSINDDTGLEYEADVMGAKALSNGAQSNNAPVQHQGPKEEEPLLGKLNPVQRQGSKDKVQRSASAAAISATPPLQRRVGFEYEMTDINTRRRNIFGNGSRQHRKGEKLRTRPGYLLTADLDVNGVSQLEVIFNAIDEANAAAVLNLVNITAPAAVAAVTAIANGAANWTRANQIAGVGGSRFDEYRFMGNGVANIVGQLQMTGGIDPAKLLLHMTGSQATNYLATLAPMGGGNFDDDRVRGTLAPYEPLALGMGLVIGPHALAAVNNTAALNGVTQAERDYLAGIAALMATIPHTSCTAAIALPYAKSAAGAHLARTDFARMLMTLSVPVKAALTTADMQQIVLTTINNAGVPVPVLGADPVLPAAAIGGGAPPLNALSIDNWIAGVMPNARWVGGYRKGRDRLTKKHFPGGQAERDEMESLGGYGNRLDPGGFPILEFRTLTGVALPDLTEQLRRLLDFINH